MGTRGEKLKVKRFMSFVSLRLLGDQDRKEDTAKAKSPREVGFSLFLEIQCLLGLTKKIQSLHSFICSFIHPSIHNNVLSIVWPVGTGNTVLTF